MAYVTASILVDADMTKGHSPGLPRIQPNVFSRSIYRMIYKLFGE